MKDKFRQCFIGTNQRVLTAKGYVRRVFFNNGATDLILKPVQQRFNEILPHYTYTNEHYTNSKWLTKEYEAVRQIVLDYVGGDKEQDGVIYAENATEAINILSHIYQDLYPDGIILTSKMEHMANYLPWVERMKVEVIEQTECGDIDIEDYEAKLKRFEGKIKLVAITGAANVTGVMPNINKLAEIAHQYKARIFVDTAQVIQHKPFTMRSHKDASHIDLIAFSAHKCYTGLAGGVLVGDKDVLCCARPFIFGAGMTKFVNLEKVIYEEMPARYEAGYPDILGVLCMGETLKCLKKMNIKEIAEYEGELRGYLVEGLKTVPKVKLYGEEASGDRIPFVAFNIEGMDAVEVANKLGYKYGIVVTAGQMGADIYVQSLLGMTPQEAYKTYKKGETYGMVRASLCCYNTCSEVDKLIGALKKL